MYFPDGDKYRYMLDVELPGVQAIGWLDRNHPFRKGEIDICLVEGLISIAVSSAVNQTRGLHGCPLCGGDDDPTIQRDGERRLVLGSAEIWILGSDGAIFASPDMLIHSIVAHGYLPPPDYLVALRWFLECKPAWNGDAVRREVIRCHRSP